MQVTLNPDKKDNDICGISQRFYFTFENPGPFEVDVNTLTNQEKVQFYASWKAGKLIIENGEDLESQIETKAKVSKPITEHQVAQAKSEYKPVDEQVLKKLRRQKVNDIKKAIPTLSIKELKVFLDLEKQAKNTRPGIVKMVSDIIDKHTAQVMAGLAGASEEDMFKNPTKHVAGELSVQQYLDSITDVVDYDSHEVEIKIGAPKDSEE